MKNHSLLLKKERKKVKLVIFGDGTSKRIDPSFKARCAKSLALSYSVESTKG